VKMSRRHFSVGADGLVLICPSRIADAKMRMFNADGSEGKMCGNAIRCVGKYLYDNGIVQRNVLKVDTASGVKKLRLNVMNGQVDTVQVEMGTAEFEPEKIPVLWKGRMTDQPVKVAEREYRITAVSMGNPHAVIFTDEVDTLPLEQIGPKFEQLPLFPERVNTEFVRVIDRSTLQMRVWERGSGETYACGTGACAAVAAAVVNGLCESGKMITVRLKGGELMIVCGKDFKILMTGRAEKVFEGVYDYADPDQ